MAINVFLGVYQPGEDIPDIWDLTTDYYLHHTMARVLPSSHTLPNHTKWWDSELIDSLPLPLYRGKYSMTRRAIWGIITYHTEHALLKLIVFKLG